MTNTYSPTWFATFLDPIPPAQTEAEISAVAGWLPLPAYRRVLDLCCGSGRHARALAARGYQVTGLDRDPAALVAARRQDASAVDYRDGDMRDLAAVPGPFDAVVNLWQSFGYFDAGTNAAVLGQIHGALRPGGRLVLDIYHRGFFAAHQGERQFAWDGRTIVEHKAMSGDRLTVHLDYGPGRGTDTFAWQLYTPEAITALAAACGFHRLVACSGFDEHTAPSAEVPRMQLAFART